MSSNTNYNELHGQIMEVLNQGWIGRIDHAIRMAKSLLQSQEEQERMLAEIAGKLGDQGEFTYALETINQIADPEQRVFALKLVIGSAQGFLKVPDPIWYGMMGRN